MSRESEPDLAHRLRGFGATLLNWVYPPSCAGCGKEGEVFCEDCLDSIIKIRQPGCIYCGLSLPRPGVCSRCASESFPYEAMAACAVYTGPLRKGIHAMKYENNFWLGSFFSSLMIPLIQNQGWKFDLVMPIPLCQAHQEERGYNQAALLAKPIAKHFGSVCEQQSLYRVKETRSQVSLTREERFENVRGAFKAKPRADAKGLNVLLVDDVFTTGATISEAAKALKAAGYGKVYAITLAKAALAEPLLT